MTEPILQLLGGLVLIVKGGDWFVAAAVRVAGFLRMPRVVIGSTIVSLATTTPELVVSIFAGRAGQPGLAVGNAVGSCICNIALILGVSAAVREIRINPAGLIRPLVVMVAVSLALFISTFDLRLGRPTAAMLIAAGVGYFIWDFVFHMRQRSPAVKEKAQEIAAAAGRRFIWLETRVGTLFQFFGAAGVVVVGSQLLVKGAVAVAMGLGVAPLVIGLTVVAIGTSLPELITALTSARKAVSDLSVGNVLGANIANLTLIVGVAALQSNVTLERSAHFFHFPVMLVLMILLFWRLVKDRCLSRRDGAILLGSYAAYMAAVIIVATW